MKNYFKVGKLQVAHVLYDFINEEALLGTGTSSEQFWDSFTTLIDEFAEENKVLLKERENFQAEIDRWHKDHQENFQFGNYKQFLEDIGYLEQEVEDFQITTDAVDDELVLQAGPQLVVPVNNARYAINAANARWGSLYDALYGTDVISEENGCEQMNEYNPIRGEKVIAFAKQFLDDTIPLENGSHKDCEFYSIDDGRLQVTLKSGITTMLKNNQQFIGFNGMSNQPNAILLKNNGLHIEIQIDRNHPIGKTDLANVKDIILESAITTIMDFEDSVAAVDAEDKVEVYRNWLGLMQGNLTASFQKGEKQLVRKLNSDRTYNTANGTTISLPGRSLLFVRNVGHLMTNNAVLYGKDEEVPEGIMDGLITSLIAKHDLLNNSQFKNSKKDSVYIVKPKMHGPKEVAFANRLFDRIEELLGLPRNTLKIGVMDEERRTTLNLKNSIYEVKDRIVFINTGFLDRTGDEIHTSMEAGPMIRKSEMKSSNWLQAYEQSNVTVGINTGFVGHAQIGKGMWAMPDLMAQMVKEKINHLKAGANTAWVPSPTAATLHAIHYHQFNVITTQNEMIKSSINEDLKNLILQFPVAQQMNWSAEEIQHELNNNAQSILGYVVRWVEQGVGCSKVPDINNVALMEDRATLRISSQHMANWLHHGICNEKQVIETMKRMAKIVDGQNGNDPVYQPMAINFEESIAFQAACELIFQGRKQPSGYTEPILHRRRLEAKEKQQRARVGK